GYNSDQLYHMVEELSNRYWTLGAQQAIERDGPFELVLGIDDIKLPKPVRQVRRLAHVVDRLSDRPRRRHRDEFRLHAAPGRVFRIEQAACQRDPFARRELFQDLPLLVLR